jgi:uncharacterized protein
MLNRLLAGTLLTTSALCALAQAPAAAPAPAPAPVSAEKKALVARVLELQRPAIENMARLMAEQPAAQLAQLARAELQRATPERREVLARELDADMRKYIEDTVPVVQDRALKAAPSTMGAVLEARMDEADLKQLIAALESPGLRKFQALGNEMQSAIGQRTMADSRATIETNGRALEQAMRKRLTPPASAPAATPAKPAAPAKN